MKRLMPIFIVILLSGCGILTAYAPNMLSMIVVAVMGVVVLLGIIYGLIPVLTFTQGLLTGQKSIQRASEAEEKSVWITALQMDRFFRQKKMDQLFREYRDKVKQQRQNGQIVSDLEDILNEDVLALYSWQGVVAQIPGTLTGLGILGTFIGLLRGLRNINFVTVEAALSSVQSILTGIDIAFYTSIAGVILSILFNISNNILRNTMDREMGIFLEVFHRVVLPTTQEQERYRSRRETRQIMDLLDRLPKKDDYSASGMGATADSAIGNERLLMPQILNGLKKNEFIFLLQPQYELNTRKIIGAEALVRWNHPALGEISPAVFIPVLENNGYITKLDQKIWEDVCAMIRRWIDEGVKPLAISINVTKTDLLAMDVVEIFDELLKKYRIPPKYLNIDIAENAYKEVYGIVSEVEKSLQQKGFRIALDGFDGDYMGLHSVGEIGADVLKLDLRSLNKEKKSGSVQDVFDRAKTLRLTLTAEGIESMEQLSLLRKCGCTEGQGYVFSRPLSIEEFEKILKVGQDACDGVGKTRTESIITGSLLRI